MITRKNLPARPLRRGLAAGALLAPLLAAGAAAQSIHATGPSQIAARLLPGRLDGAERLAGLALAIAPGWKTYWRVPGESGVPPRFDWSGSGNLAGVEVLWPAPEVFESFGMMSIGYGGEVVLPLRLVPEDPTRPIALELAAEFGVCRDICIFEEVRIAETVAPADTEGAAEVAAALARLPGTDLARATCRIAGAGPDRRFTAEIAHAAPGPAPYVVIEGPAGAWFHEVEATPAPRAIDVEAVLSLEDPAAWVPREDVRITLLGEGWAADIRGCAAPD